MIRPMFPAARCFFVPLHPQPHATIPFRRAPAATTVSAKPRRWTRGPRRDRSWDDDGGGSDSDADDGFFGQEPDDGDDEPEREEPTPGRSASPFAAPAGGQLRGSDVLRALQRAAAAKEAARRKKDKRPAAPRRSREKPVGGGVEEAGEVRPVLIRPEWAARIRELEGRVEQLADKYHHHQ